MQYLSWVSEGAVRYTLDVGAINFKTIAISPSDPIVIMMMADNGLIAIIDDTIFTVGYAIIIP